MRDRSTIFVSYCSADGERARALVSALQRLNHKVRWDGMLRVGDLWWDAIAEHLAKSDLVVLALSPSAARSRSCLREVEHAQTLAKPILGVEVRCVDPAILPVQLTALRTIPCVPRYLDAAIRVAR